MPSVKLQSKASGSRVFTIEDRAGPSHTPVYQSLARAQSPSQDFGNITLIRIPDPNQYGKFIVADSIRDAAGQPTITVQFRHTRAISDMLRLARKGCPMDVQIHMGACKDPSDFQLGWDKILVIEGAQITTWGADDLGAFDPSNEAVVNENVPFSGLDMYEIVRVTASEIASTQVTQEVVAIAICDSPTCGDCGRTSDGCQRVFAMTTTSGGSPGAGARLIYSRDGGTTIATTQVTTMGAAENAIDMACVGNNLVIISNGGLAIHYANTDDIINGVATWTKVVTGLVAAKAPNDILSLGRTFTWMVGDGGYVYFSSDITAGATAVQDAGIATVQNLNAVAAADDQNLVAVGASNAVIRTVNGGNNWSSITGPEVGAALNTVVMRSPSEWMIGTATGKLWYTTDSGKSWTQKRFSGDQAGAVRRIVFPTPTVGYMAHDTAAPVGRILRTIDGGASWITVPEDTNFSFPTNIKMGALASCSQNPNIAFAGGNRAAADGILIKLS